MNKKKLVFGSLLIGSVLAARRLLFAKLAMGKPASSSSSFEDVDEYVEGQMRRLKIPGAALAVVEGDRIVHQRGFGKARPGGEVPTPQTPFFIGSITKSITALAVMQLVEAGKVELDAPVQCYLPWFRVADAQASAQITVRHLLNQTSGLPYFDPSISLADFSSDLEATERQVRAYSGLKLSHPVGAKFQYSNLNYNILGLIVEAASGERYVGYIQNHIFKPLEMNHTYTEKVEAQRNGLAMGYRHWFGLPIPTPNLPVPSGSLPSGQLISCTEDIAHYLIAHLNNGRYDGAQILSPVSIDELHRGVAEFIQFGISAGFYGMGWIETDLGQTKTFSHGGNVPEFSAFMALVPEQKKALVLLMNADPYGLPPITEEIGMGVTAVLAGIQPPPIRLGFVPWIMRLLPLIPLLQIVGVITTLRSLHQWDRESAAGANRRSLWGRYILLPLLPNLSLAAILAYLQSSGVIRFLHLFMPDLAWTVHICGTFAGIWAVLRTGLILRRIYR